MYVNYAHGDEPLEAIYGAEKLPRLIGLKQKWDPNNIFAFNNALPTSLEGYKGSKQLLGERREG